MNDNRNELMSIIYDDSIYRGFFRSCSEVRHDRNRGADFGRLGFYLNGAYSQTDEGRRAFLEDLRRYPLSRAISIDARYLDDEEVMAVLRESPDVQEVRIIDNGYAITNEVISRFPEHVVVICDAVAETISNELTDRVYVQHGAFKSEINYIEDDLVSAYFVDHELSDLELDHLVQVVNNDTNGDYRHISLRMYQPTKYREFIQKLKERGLKDDVRLHFLGNPLTDKVEAFQGLDEICDNPISITYDTCGDMVDFYQHEPFTVSNMHHSELEGGGKASFQSYFNMLNILETQERHIKEQGYSPLEAMIYAYRYLQQNYAYDPNSDQTDDENVLTNRQLDLVAGSRTLVCEGYATLYSALMRRCKIPVFRYSTDRHVRNIGRVVDPKYGVDMIGVLDPTWDGSYYTDDGVFIENRDFKHFMVSPRSAVNLDSYVTIPSSLVLDYDLYETPFFSFLSRDRYETRMDPFYRPDGYAMTMLGMMGIQLPEPLEEQSYRELLRNLNQTSIFTEFDPQALLDAYETVMRRENPELSDYEILSRQHLALVSLSDRLNDITQGNYQVLVNDAEESLGENNFYVPAFFYNMEQTLNIAQFNATSGTNHPAEGTSGSDDTADSSAPTNGEEDEHLDNNAGVEVLDDDTDDAHVTHDEVLDAVGDAMAQIEVVSSFENLSAGDVADAVDDAMNGINVGNADDYIPGTHIRKPRFRGDYETDEEYVAYLADYYGRYFPQAVQETRENDSTYSYRRDEIIQDLPIYSRQPSRFTGVMTEAEIEESRNKIR